MRRVDAVAAQFAETTITPEYRQTLDAAFDAAPNDEIYVDQRTASEALLYSMINEQPQVEERAWELRRQALLTELGGTSLGAFNDYFQKQGGASTPSTRRPSDLEKGRFEVIRTNNAIVSLNTFHEEPIDFIEDALDLIDEQASTSRGPENYATTLKYFVDKYQEFPSLHLDRELIKDAVSRCMDGFTKIAERDRPNFVEMTNLYSAIRVLPTGSFDKVYTNDIIRHSIEQMPDYDTPALRAMIASMSKLDLSESGESAATLVDLALRKASTMERTADMAQAVRAVANLPASPAAERTFVTLLQFRNNLEQSLDLEGLDVVNDALLRTVDGTISDPGLLRQAKNLAEHCARRSVRLVQQKERLGEITAPELARLKATANRIIRNYNMM